MIDMSILELLYKTKSGRILLKPLISKPISDMSGFVLDSGISKLLISPFVRMNNIDLSDYRLDGIRSFNDFFCRKIKPGRRPVDMDKDVLIAPCDGKLSVCKISGGSILSVKQSHFTVARLLRDRKLAATFNNGYALIFRLCVDNYHRYIYFDSGRKYHNRGIEGVYHTVRPIALEEYPVFIENTREYSVIDTDSFGRCVQMEVGAMLVGRIVNKAKGLKRVRRGEEKGHFEYGGSTIIVLVPDGKVKLRKDIYRGINKNTEIPVKMGEVIGGLDD